jgi:hypothetical protein
MKRFLLLLVLAAISIGCGAQEVSTKPTTWNGEPGTAVTIRLTKGTLKYLEGSQEVSFWGINYPFVIPSPSVPVMKLERRAVTVFLNNDDTLLDAIRKGGREGTLFVARYRKSCDKLPLERK